MLLFFFGNPATHKPAEQNVGLRTGKLRCGNKEAKTVNDFHLRSFLSYSDCTEVGIAYEM